MINQGLGGHWTPWMLWWYSPGFTSFPQTETFITVIKPCSSASERADTMPYAGRRFRLNVVTWSKSQMNPSFPWTPNFRFRYNLTSAWRITRLSSPVYFLMSSEDTWEVVLSNVVELRETCINFILHTSKKLSSRAGFPSVNTHSWEFYLTFNQKKG